MPIPPPSSPKTSFTHTYCARWRKIFWLGQEPPAIEIRYNLPYMISTGLLPKYDTSLVVPESTIASKYASWLNSSHDIMGNGIIYRTWADVAGRRTSACIPTWTARYLLTMDNRMKEISLNCGDLSGSVPIHFRESDSARTASYRHIITIDDRPTIWLGNWWNYDVPVHPGQAARCPSARPPASGARTWPISRTWRTCPTWSPATSTTSRRCTSGPAWNLASSNWEYRQGNKGIC